MIRYYILLFARNLKRQKLFSFINLLGLSVSIASTLLIYLYVRHEFTFDSFHPHTERLYRVNQTFIWAENPEAQFSRTGPGVAVALKEELPEVEMVTSLHTPGNFIISYTTPAKEVVAFEETEVFAADTNFFKIFNFPLIKGNAGAAFRQANTLMMTKSTAEKYFGKEDPIGKLVRLGTLNSDKQETYEVTGVIEDTPENSTIQFGVLLSMKSFPVEKLHWSWVWTQLETFVRLHPQADIEQVREKLKLIPRKRADQTLRAAMNTTYDEYIKSGKKWDLYLQPMTSLHLPDEPVVGSFPDTGNIKIIYSLIGAVIFIVLLSCINFMNLSTAQFTRRIKEASVRKILGMGKIHLSINYFIEALAFCFIALITALAMSQILLPAFNLITGKALKLDLFGDSTVISALLLLVLLMAVISSSYPALFLSRFNPVEAIKGKLKVGTSGRAFRNGLVIFQFSVSVILIICTAIVYEQLNYVSEKDLGFDKENLIQVKHAEGAKNIESLVKAAMNIPGAVNASWCSSAPPEVFGGDTFSAEGMTGQNFSLNYTSGDDNFIPTLGIKIKYGRNFSADNPADSNAVIINEATVKRLGWNLDESVIGKKISYPNANQASFEVIGIVSDFNYWSLAAAIEPMGIFHIKNKQIFDGPTDQLVVRIQGQSADAWTNTIASLKNVWHEHAGDTPFEYGFIDEYFEQTFKTQQRFGTVLTVMAFLAIMIACLGLLGMIIYAIEQRTKEIGIRKVSGASVLDILVLISKGYTKLIVIAFVIGAPLSYWMMKQWLQDFAYRVTPSPWIFFTTGIAILIIAMLITSYHSVKAALINPVDVLKDE
jgi:putative ABC transport system permease protein